MTLGRTSRRVLRSVLITGIALLATGPAPGHTGGCGDEVEPASALEFCVRRDDALVLRQAARGEIDAQQTEVCRAQVRPQCELTTGDNWPFTCLPAPSHREVEACIEALLLVSNLETPLEQIDECRVCPSVRPEPECGGGS